MPLNGARGPHLLLDRGFLLRVVLGHKLPGGGDSLLGRVEDVHLALGWEPALLVWVPSLGVGLLHVHLLHQLVFREPHLRPRQTVLLAGHPAPAIPNPQRRHFP